VYFYITYCLPHENGEILGFQTFEYLQSLHCSLDIGGFYTPTKAHNTQNISQFIIVM